MTAAQYTGIGMLAAFFLAIFLGMRSQIGTWEALGVFAATIATSAFIVYAIYLIGGWA